VLGFYGTCSVHSQQTLRAQKFLSNSGLRASTYCSNHASESQRKSQDVDSRYHGEQAVAFHQATRSPRQSLGSAPLIVASQNSSTKTERLKKLEIAARWRLSLVSLYLP
jgi:hypothetical protein